MIGLTKGIVMANITEGVIIGVSSGVIVSILLWLKHDGIDYYRNRRKEIKRLSHIIQDFRERIYSAETFNFKGKVVDVNEQRKAYLDDMIWQLYNALDQGSPNLSYDEKQAVRNPVFPYKKLYPENRPNIETYNEIFGTFEKLKWLKLPVRNG